MNSAPCGYEGPRGGGCHRTRVWMVEAGNRTVGAHALTGACDEHLDDMRAWAFRITNEIPRVTRDNGPSSRTPRLFDEASM